MEKTTEAILIFLLNNHYIGGKHFPENKIFKSKTKRLNREEKKLFQKEYKLIINNGYIIRERKRTGKSSSYHLHLNQSKLKEINELIQNG